MTPACDGGVYPVILRVPEAVYQPLPPKGRVRLLSRWARRAAVLSAGLRGAAVSEDQLAKDPDGRPLPLGGGYWSVSHKPRYAAGIFSPEPAGIDIERVRPYRAGLRQKVAAPDEWRLMDLSEPSSFFRVWTAKEAVLKVGGVGIAHLLKCRIRQVEGRHRLQMAYQGRTYHVRQLSFDDHIAAVVEGACPIVWVLPEPDAVDRA